MSAKEDLGITLITYNRKEHLKKTFENLFSEDSPIKDYDILILDNNSTDGTGDFVKDFMKSHPNLRYQKNKYNVGISGNIAKAMEIADKEYLWILCDDDDYYWENWHYVEDAINKKEDVICAATNIFSSEYPRESIGAQLLQITFVASVIFKTKVFNDNIMRNTFDSIFTLFPHICPVLDLINKKVPIHVIPDGVVGYGGKASADGSYTRGLGRDYLYQRTKTMSWLVGYANILSIIKNNKIKHEAFNVGIKFVCNNFEKFCDDMLTIYPEKEDLMQLVDVYMQLDKDQQKKFIEYLQKADGYDKDQICFYKRYLKRRPIKALKSFLNQIFSVNNEGNVKILTILGFKIKFKLKDKIK